MNENLNGKMNNYQMMNMNQRYNNGNMYYQQQQQHYHMQQQQQQQARFPQYQAQNVNHSIHQWSNNNQTQTHHHHHMPSISSYPFGIPSTTVADQKTDEDIFTDDVIQCLMNDDDNSNGDSKVVIPSPAMMPGTTMPTNNGYQQNGYHNGYQQMHIPSTHQQQPTIPFYPNPNQQQNKYINNNNNNGVGSRSGQKQQKITARKKQVVQPVIQEEAPPPPPTITAENHKIKHDPIKMTNNCVASIKDLKNHLKQIKTRQHMFISLLSDILTRIKEDKRNFKLYFSPANPTKFYDYARIVQNPIDFGQVRSNLEGGKYETFEKFAEDCRLVFNNWLICTTPNTPLNKLAVDGLAIFENEWKEFLQFMTDFEARDARHSCSNCFGGNSCNICGLKCIPYEILPIRCSPPCNAKIQRDATYYRWGGERGQHWCAKCFTALPNEFIGFLGEQLKKSDVEQLVFNQVYLEPFIQCTQCQQYTHQTCGLHNRYASKSNQEYTCPNCITKGSEAAAAEGYICSMPRATEIPHTHMGAFLERRMKQRILSEISPKEKAEQVAATLTLRVVSAHDTHVQYDPRFARWMEAQTRVTGSPPTTSKQFPFRSKTILIFQRIDGVDVLLFVMYVQEYGPNCPKPNRNKVYVSYLDSISYMTPRSIRTSVYQEVMCSYFHWMKERGFEYIYIWACPPSRGDAYILFCHPKWQKTPTSDRLRKWYSSIVQRSVDEDVIMDVKNLHQKHFAAFPQLISTRSVVVGAKKLQTKGKSNKHENGDMEQEISLIEKARGYTQHIDSVPYFYGDFIPTELEKTLAIQEKTQGLAEHSYDGGAREWWLNVWGASALYVITDDAETENEPKDNASSSASTKDKVRRVQYIDDAFDGQGNVTKRYLISSPVNLDSLDLASLENIITCKERDEWMMRSIAATLSGIEENFMVLQLREADESDLASAASSSGVGGGYDDSTRNETKRKRPRKSSNKSRALNGVSFEIPNIPKEFCDPVTGDPDEALPNTVFNTRLHFLDLCQAHHLQFDELRRTKHSSIVLLHSIKKSFFNWQGMNSSNDSDNNHNQSDSNDNSNSKKEEEQEATSVSI